MKPWKRNRPTPAMLVSLLALSVALGGTATAAHQLTSRQIATGAITARTIAPGAVTPAKLSAPATASVSVGARGLQGPAGPAGLPGADPRFVAAFSSGYVWVQPGETKFNEARCAIPDDIVSGGYVVTDQNNAVIRDPAVHVVESVPYVAEHPGRNGDNDSWNVGVYNGSAAPIEFDARAICMRKGT